MSSYSDLIAGVRLVLATAAGTPFRRVEAGVELLSDEALAQLVTELGSGNTAPAALVFLGGSEADGGKAGELTETCSVGVIVLDAGRSRAAAAAGDGQTPGVFALVEWVRQKLHYIVNVPGVVNPPQFVGQDRFRVPGQALSVAAQLLTFKVALTFADEPVDWNEPS